MSPETLQQAAWCPQEIELIAPPANTQLALVTPLCCTAYLLSRRRGHKVKMGKCRAKVTLA